jgi:hypothetical protein
MTKNQNRLAAPDSGADQRPGTGEAATGENCEAEAGGPDSGREAQDPELDALAAMSVLGNKDARYLLRAFVRLGVKRSKREPERAARAYRRAFSLVPALGAVTGAERGRHRRQADKAMAGAARDVWREAVALAPGGGSADPRGLYGGLSEIDAESRRVLSPQPDSLTRRPKPRPAQPKSLLAQAHALRTVEEACLDLFWRNLTGVAGVPTGLGPMSRSWALVRTGDGLARTGGPLAAAFLFRGLHGNEAINNGYDLILDEVAEAAARLPAGPREVILLLVIKRATEKLGSARAMVSREKTGRLPWATAASVAKGLAAQEAEAARLDWLAPLLTQEKIGAGVEAARELYGTGDARRELESMMCVFPPPPWVPDGSEPWPQAEWNPIRINYLAWEYDSVMCPANARKIAAAWLEESAADRGRLSQR